MVVTLIGIALRQAVIPLLGTGFTFLFAFPAAMTAAWYGGLGPGLLSTLMSTAGALLLLEPRGSYATIAGMMRLAIFLLSGTLISLLSQRLHRATRRAITEAEERDRTEQMLTAAQQLAHIGSWELELGKGANMANLADHQTGTLRWSDECYRIFGYAPGEAQVSKEQFFAAVHPDDRASVVTKVAEALRSATGYQIEHRIVRPDGSERNIFQSGTIIRNRAGGPLRLLGSCQDITARKRAESILREREDLLRLITDAAPALISYIDSNYRYQLANRAYERWLGKTPAQMQGRHVKDVLGTAAWEAVKPHIDRALGGEEVSYEEELLYSQSGPRWVHVTYTPDRDPLLHVRGLVVLVSDISDRKLTEARLRRAAERTERLRLMAAALAEASTYEQVARVTVEHGLVALDAIAGCVAMLDEHERVLEITDSIGYDPAVMAAWRHVPATANVPLAEAVRTGQPVFLTSSEERSRRFPGLPSFLMGRPMGASASAPMAMTDRVIGALGFTWAEPRTFTAEDEGLALRLARQCAQAMDRARLYAAEQRARAQAEAASRAKDEFLAMLGHELRNPLAPIVTALHLMDLRGDATSLRERRVIERQVQHLIRLVDDLLDISRVTRGKIQLRRTSVELAEVVAKALEMASPLLEERQHRLRIDVPHEGLRIDADEARIAQVLANLLTNAAKYTDVGGDIWLRAGCEESDVVVTVKDTGMGMAPELLPRVFDLFVQGQRSLDRGQGGLGLGLALVRSLVELHGGTVAATSDGPGRGCEFTVRLPALATLDMPEGPRVSPSMPRALHPKRILVVDDNVDAAELLANLLRHQGHSVVVANDGPDALEIIERGPPDVAVLDIGLPVMDGYELALKIRDQLGDRTPCLVALTGYGQDSDRIRSQAAGFREHLIKPVDIDSLSRAITCADAGESSEGP